MATAARTRAKSTQASKVISQVQSLNLVKNVFRASLSSIAYIRNLFGDECFEDGEMGGTRYKKLSKADLDSNKEAAMFLKWLEDGVFDALTKKYLSTVLLEVYEELPGRGRVDGSPLSEKRLDETQMASSGEPIASKGAIEKNERRLLEVFSFSVEYPDGGAGEPQFRLSFSGDDAPTTTKGLREAMKKSTSDILRQLVELTSTLAPLPKNRVVSMKLMYTPKTPSDYEPPLFRAADEEATSCWFENKPLRLSPGKVQTPYHQMLIHIRTSVDTRDQNHEDEFMRDAVTVESSESSSSHVIEEDAAENEVDKLQKLKINDDVEVPDTVPTESPVIDIGESQGNTCRALKVVKPQSESNDLPGKAQTLPGKLGRGNSKPDIPASVLKPDDISSFACKVPAGMPHPKYISQKFVPAVPRNTVGKKRPPLPPKFGDIENADSQAPSFANRKPRRKVSETVNAIYQRPKRRRLVGQPSQNHRGSTGKARIAENVSSAH